MEVARGADGSGVPAAEPLPLIAAGDQDQCQMGTQSCGSDVHRGLRRDSCPNLGEADPCVSIGLF